MSISRLFPRPWQRRGRRAKPKAPSAFLAVETLEDRTTPAVSSVPLSGLGGLASAGAMQATAGAPSPIQSSPMLQALLRQASQGLNALSSSLTSLAVQVNVLATSSFGNPQQQIGNLLPQLQGSLIATTATLNSVASRLSGLAPGRAGQEVRALASALRSFASSLGTVSVGVNDLVASLPPAVGPLTSLTGGFPNSTTAFLGGLLTGLSRNTRALSRTLNVLAGNPSATTTQVANAVLVGVNAGLGNVALSLNAFAGTLSGATAAATGNGSPLLLITAGAGSPLFVGTTGTVSPLLDGSLQVLSSTLATVQNSLNALAGILPTAARLPLGNARPLLRLAFTNAAAQLSFISASLGFIQGPFSGALATSFGGVVPTVGVVGGSLGNTSLAVGTLFGDAAGSLGQLALSLGALGRSLPGLTPAALVRVTGVESNLLGSAAADIGQLTRELTIAPSLLGLNGFPASATPANGAQVIDALFVTVSQNLDLVSADLLRLTNGT
ncbi:MAG TPA: hypothetical protein VJ739_03600 [Gemmataceae bacterium]|nr:hypothetical protein [Gemmataceae bacterium]